MSGQVGEEEKNVQLLFQTVRSHDRVVLFLDEVEALVPSRRKNGSTIMARVISQFLSEVDGLGSNYSGNTLLLIGATNEPDMLDLAMLRPGRFDTKIYVGPPDQKAREHILRLLLGNRPLAADVRIVKLAETTQGQTGAEICHFVQQAADHAFLRAIGENGTISPKLHMIDFEGLLMKKTLANH